MMRFLTLGAGAILILAQPLAFASDISLFGGRLIDETQNQNSVAASIGFDIPASFGPFSPSQLRFDLGYLFTNINLPADAIANPNAILDIDFGTVTAHAGPTWRLGALGRASVFAGVQAGVAISRVETQIIGSNVPTPMNFDDVTDTSFSYQIPVGFEYSFNRRFGITTRYRLIGFTNGGHATDHVLEGGIIVKF